MKLGVRSPLGADVQLIESYALWTGSDVQGTQYTLMSSGAGDHCRDQEVMRVALTQVFNTFYETGLANSTPANQLFILPGHNFVHVLLGNEYASEKHQKPIIHDDLAQEYLDFILTNLTEGDKSGLFEPTEHTKQVHKSFDVPETCAPSYTAWNYPPPDQPEEHTFKAFLHLHVTSMLDQVTNRSTAFGPAPVAYELPTCKSWFMACYKLYTSLMSDDTPASDGAHGKPDNHSSGSLAQSWLHAFHMAISPSSASLRNSATLCPSVLDTETDSNVRPAGDVPTTSPNDVLRRLSDVRCRAALSAAEAHYKSDLPIHYSNTYHLVKVVSAFNVFLSLARGPAVFRALEQLSQRLAHIYLAGRVTCSAVSVTGHACQYEMHRVPDDAAPLRAVLAGLDRRTLYADDGALDRAYASRAPGYRRNHHHHQNSLDAKMALTRVVPSGLMGKWRAYWIESLLACHPSEATELLSPGDPTPLGENQEPPKSSSKDTTTGITDSASLDGKQHLAVMPHRSQHLLRRSCNCGRVQDLCWDPFDYKDANWRFYASMDSVCCNKLASIPLAPLCLMHPGHLFCLPQDEEVRDSERLATGISQTHSAAQNVSTEPTSVVSGANAEPVAVLTRRLAAPEDSTGGMPNDDGNGDKLSGSMLDPGGLSQPRDNPLLMLSSADSIHQEQVTSSQGTEELVDVGFDEAVNKIRKSFDATTNISLIPLKLYLFFL
ncbi:unnamed protein product [Echinostoma caproni]|uniref:Nonsense-mediated mRNA decay factor SMG8 n=1 Tax=Echinostoma caproni TaxID=27848 RepID=A0A183AVK9_9TREM|nr:unnamed protein product [Echinostoma caproni]